MNPPNDPQYLVPELIQELGEPLDSPVPPMPPLEGTDNADDNSVVNLSQSIYTPDTIGAINVPKVATLAVTNVALEEEVPQVLASTVKESRTNTDTSHATDPLGTPTVVVHDKK